ncbi:hypothetical protein D3C76_630200 [compost metagenome]
MPQVGEVGRQAQAALLHLHGLRAYAGLSEMVLQVSLVGATEVQFTAQCGERSRREW